MSDDITTAREVEGLRKRSGDVLYHSRLVSFLYGLMRDHLPVGDVEQLALDSVEEDVSYSNGWLAQYARDLEKRLVSRPHLGALAKQVLLNKFVAVRDGAMTPETAAHELHTQLVKILESWPPA